ncbi:MAG: hypothetical protein AAFR20_06585 [Pseudomonadota bacterium]
MADFGNRASRLFADTAPRTQYALIALGFVLGLSAILSVGDRVAVMRGEHDVLAKRLAQYGDGIDVERWQSRVSQSDAILTDWQSHYWKGPTAGIIAAQIRSTLTEIGQRALLERITIEVDPVIIDLEARKALRFQIIGRSSDAVDVIKTLSGMAGAKPALPVSELALTVRQDDSGAFTASGLAFIDVETAAAPAGSETGQPGGRAND